MIALVRFTIPGAPRTKKNSEVLDLRGKKPRKLASAASRKWNESAQAYLATVRSRARRGLLPFAQPANCRATFYRDAERGDAVGYYQALADALQEGGIVQNDALIVSWDGTRLHKDARNPRVEVLLEVAGQ